MVFLGLSHVPPRLCIGDADATLEERLAQRGHRRLTTEVNDGAGPIQNHQIEAIAYRHHGPPPNKSWMSSSPIANPVDAPEPVVIITRRTASAGASMNMVRSL